MKKETAESSRWSKETYKQQEDKVNDRFNHQTIQLQSEINQLKTEIQAKQTKRDDLMNIAQQEADGTGGSKQKSWSDL